MQRRLLYGRSHLLGQALDHHERTRLSQAFRGLGRRRTNANGEQRPGGGKS